MHDDKQLLFLMRHAKSEQAVDGMTDFDRPLNERGEDEPKVIAKELNHLGLAIERAIVSTARRTIDTWLLLEKKLAKPPEVIFDRRLYNANYQDAIEVLIEEAQTTKSLLMIGHNPSVTEICEYLCGEYHEFKPASCAVLVAQEKTLAASLAKPGLFKLDRLIAAK